MRTKFTLFFLMCFVNFIIAQNENGQISDTERQVNINGENYLPREYNVRSITSSTLKTPLSDRNLLNPIDRSLSITSKSYLTSNDFPYLTIHFGQGSGQNSVINMSSVNGMGQVVSNYLPTPDQLNNLDFKPSDQFRYIMNEFYSDYYFNSELGSPMTNVQSNYFKNIYDNSPNSELAVSIKPGPVYTTSNGIIPALNNNLFIANENLPKFKFSDNAQVMPEFDDLWLQSSLRVSEVIDEDGYVIRTYTNSLGQVLFVRKAQYLCGGYTFSQIYSNPLLGLTEPRIKFPQGADSDGPFGNLISDERIDIVLEPGSRSSGCVVNEWLTTAYIYDDFGNLRTVVSPEAFYLLEQGNWVFTESILNELCFYYLYDFKGRLSSQKEPGKSRAYFVYDKFNEILLTTSDFLLDNNVYLITIYDGFRRKVCSIEYAPNANLDLTQIQVAIDSRNYTYLSDEIILFAIKNKFIRSSVLLNFISSAPETVKVLEYHLFDEVDVVSSDFSYLSDHITPPNEAYNSIQSNHIWRNLLQSNVYSRADESNGTVTENIQVNYYNDERRAIQIHNLFRSNETVKVVTSVATDFLGKQLYSKETLFNDNDDFDDLYVERKNSYLINDKISDTSIRINGLGSYRKIIKYDYDEIGRVVTKRIGSNAEIQNLSYTLDGRLKSINERFVLTPSPSTMRVFGMVLNYSEGNTPLYNGAISSVSWLHKTSPSKRHEYNYTYDNYQRLGSAIHRLETIKKPVVTISESPNAGSSVQNQGSYLSMYTTENLSYDRNGNILSCRNYGVKNYGTAIIDDLVYDYFPNTNKLRAVTESSNSESVNLSEVNDMLGDFRDINDGDDYSYDEDGTLTKDRNKEISEIRNGLFHKKPFHISFLDGSSIDFRYTWNGRLSEKVINTNGVESRDSYFGSFVLKNNELMYINHGEGRVRPSINANTNLPEFSYEFDIKDYLDNVRSVVKEEYVSFQTAEIKKDKMTYVATSEDNYANTEEEFFYRVADTRADKPYPGIELDDCRSARTNAAHNKNNGPGKLLKVTAGDSLKFQVEYFYTLPDETNEALSQSVALNTILSALTSSTLFPGADLSNVFDNSSLQSLISLSDELIQDNIEVDGYSPKAALNFVAFDDEMNVLGEFSGLMKVSTAESWQLLEKDFGELPFSGYIYVFTSNVSSANVFFDNLKLWHIAGTIQQEFHYYPFGLSVNTYTHFSSSDEQPNLFNSQHFERNELSEGRGLNVYNYMARVYDPQLGRWWSVDSMADEREWLTPYNFVSNNPINRIDPDGRLDDWVERTDDNGKSSIVWDENVTSADDPDLKQEDRYLGKAVVVFEGSESEKLGKGDNLFGEGANLAKATVYGPDGPDDIKEYGAYTMSSDPSKYGTVADGEYNVYYDKVGKSGALKSNWAVEGRGKVPARGGVNPAYPSRDPGYLDGVFIHRSNNNGYAGGGVSKGCPLICPSLNNPGNGWDEFNQQLQAVSQFKMILKRD